MVAAVAVEDVERLDRVEIVLLSVRGEDLRDAGVEAAAEDGGEAGLLEPLAVRPLPRVLEVRLLGRLVVGGVQVAHSRLEACVHYREVLVRKRDVHDEIRLVSPDELHEARDVHGIDLRSLYLRRHALLREPRAALDVRLDRLAAGLGARRYQEFSEHVGVLGHLRGRDAGHSAGTDEHYFLRHFISPFQIAVFTLPAVLRAGTCTREPWNVPCGRARAKAPRCRWRRH